MPRGASEASGSAVGRGTSPSYYPKCLKPSCLERARASSSLALPSHGIARPTKRGASGFFRREGLAVAIVYTFVTKYLTESQGAAACRKRRTFGGTPPTAPQRDFNCRHIFASQFHQGECRTHARTAPRGASEASGSAVGWGDVAIPLPPSVSNPVASNAPRARPPRSPLALPSHGIATPIKRGASGFFRREGLAVANSNC